MRGYVNQQEVGRTDCNGDLFVPVAIPYYANNLAVEEKDIPT